MPKEKQKPLRKQIVELLKQHARCDIGGVGDFRDKDKASTMSCQLQNPEQLALYIENLILLKEEGEELNFKEVFNGV